LDLYNINFIGYGGAGAATAGATGAALAAGATGAALATGATGASLFSSFQDLTPFW